MSGGTKSTLGTNRFTPTRRQVLRAGAAAGALSLAGRASAAPAPEKVRIGLIGCGPQGHNSMRFTTDWFDTVAVCDVDRLRRERSKELLTGGKGEAYDDYRAILDRDDLGAVYIATPDHWRAKILIEAMHAGKDIYAEKPLTLTIDEGRLVQEAQRQTGRVVQVGTQQRSKFEHFTSAIAVVQSGRLGKIKRIQAAIDGGATCGALPAVAPPAELDWDRWLGPAPVAEYRHLSQPPAADGRERWQGNCHGNFRWWYEYSGGKMTDWGAHHVDIACWALEANGQSTTPIRFSGMAKMPVGYRDGYPTENDRYNATHAFKIDVQLEDDVELVIRHDTGNGVLIEGEKGRLFVNRGKLTGKPIEELADNPLPSDALDRAYKGMARTSTYHKAHWHNFYRCIQDRREPISDVKSHLRALNICHLANLAARLGDGGAARPLAWDDAAQRVVGDEQANALLKREPRAGYEIEV
ncbi:Inositol 2-dehydrogenase [Planctomycetes bacterium MalM25]|nr:Inositol 2-dehydrogenase [Planctomycetes bacterium MalM25]